MNGGLERLVKIVYGKWKQDSLRAGKEHPDEESLACLLEGRLTPQEAEQVKLHLLSCEDCAESFAIQLGLETKEGFDVPQELLERVKDLLKQDPATPVLEILLRLKEKALELIHATGDVLVGQELVPEPVLRSRSIKDFKDEVTVMKDFQDIRVEAKIENKGLGAFNLIVMVKQKQTQQIMKDLRVTLIKEDLELESYLTGSGSVTFEHVLLGKYTVEISTIDSKLASILLDIKV